MERKPRRRLKKGPFIVFCSLLVLLLGVGYVLASQFIYGKSPLDILDLDETKEKKVVMKDRMNFLLMGVDAREGEENTRTDTIMLVSLDKEHNRIALLSMPRDTRVKIPGQGYDKINSANVHGGPELVMETVSNLVGVEIDNYVITNVRGFRDIVDVLGGVTLDVEKRMYYYDPYDEPDLRKIDLQPGLQKLNGDKALQYVRFRSDALGDVTRTERQQKFLKVLAKEMMQPSTITKLPKLVPTINKYLDTNLGITDMVALARAAQNLSNVEIVTQTMPGKFLDMDGISFWSVDPTQARNVAKSMIQEGKVFDVVLGEEKVNSSSGVQQTNAETKSDYLPSTESGTKQTEIKTTQTGSATNQNNSKNTQRDTDTKKPTSNVEIIVKPTPGTGEQAGSDISATPKVVPDNSQQGSDSGSTSWLPTQPL